MFIPLTGVGRFVKSVFREVQGVYKAAGIDLKARLVKFNESLQDADLLIGICKKPYLDH